MEVISALLIFVAIVFFPAIAILEAFCDHISKTTACQYRIRMHENKFIPEKLAIFWGALDQFKYDTFEEAADRIERDKKQYQLSLMKDSFIEM